MKKWRLTQSGNVRKEVERTIVVAAPDGMTAEQVRAAVDEIIEDKDDFISDTWEDDNGEEWRVHDPSDTQIIDCESFDDECDVDFSVADETETEENKT